MSILMYSKYRRMKIRAAWELAGMAVVWLKEVGKYIAALLVALICVQYISDKAIAEDEAYAAQKKTEHIEQAWISCLNNKGVWINDELYTCSLENTRFTKDHWK